MNTPVPSRRPHVPPAIASALLLVIALGQHPYGYYTFLRWAVCLTAFLVAWVAFESDHRWAIWPFVVIAILFNPMAPVYLDRSTWKPIDIACAAAFLGSVALARRNRTPSART